MRNKKKAIAIIIIMTACVVFIQCSKTFEKSDEQGAIGEEQAGIEKRNRWWHREKRFFGLILLVMKIFGVDYFILIKL
jgi:hypothetical protein